MKILLAEDDAALRRVLAFKLEKRGFQVAAVGDGKAALARMEKEEFHLLLSDIRMPRLDGLDLLDQVLKTNPAVKVILITAHATVSQAVDAVKRGAFNYLTKPFEDEELFLAIEKAREFKALQNENRDLRRKLAESHGSPELIGVSPPFKELLHSVERVAPSDATVLLQGASGTGKELIGRLIHVKSGRRGDYVAVNCAALPKELIESELFGHLRGAFSGAIRDKRGKFSIADKGTLLLDEVGDLPLDVQAKLLRVLQDCMVDPVGSEKPHPVDVRVIAATHADLKERVQKGTFRQDLFFRLNVVPLRIPSLAQRKEDIPLFLKHFVSRFSGDSPVSWTQDLLDSLMTHSWPGNVRELENLVERMVVLRKSDTLTCGDLPDDFVTFSKKGGSDSVPSPGTLSLFQVENAMIRQALDQCHWNRAAAARLLDIPRHVLIYRMKKYAIEPDT